MAVFWAQEKKPIFVAVVLSTSLAAGQAGAAITGADLLRECESKSELEQARCAAYISGAADTAMNLSISVNLLYDGRKDPPTLFCTTGVTSGELVKETIKYIIKNKSASRYAAASEILLALRLDYPCKR